MMLPMMITEFTLSLLRNLAVLLAVAILLLTLTGKGTKRNYLAVFGLSIVFGLMLAPNAKRLPRAVGTGFSIGLMCMLYLRLLAKPDPAAPLGSWRRHRRTSVLVLVELAEVLVSTAAAAAWAFNRFPPERPFLTVVAMALVGLEFVVLRNTGDTASSIRRRPWSGW